MVCAETGAAMLMTVTMVSSLPNNRLMPISLVWIVAGFTLGTDEHEQSRAGESRRLLTMGGCRTKGCCPGGFRDFRYAPKLH